MQLVLKNKLKTCMCVCRAGEFNTDLPEREEREGLRGLALVGAALPPRVGRLPLNPPGLRVCGLCVCVCVWVVWYFSLPEVVCVCWGG